MLERNEVIRLRSQNKLNEICNMADRQELMGMSDADTVLNIAEVYEITKQYEKSIRWYKKALELGTNEDIIAPLSELYRITWKNSGEWEELYRLAHLAEQSENQQNMLLYEKLRSEGAPYGQLIEVISTFAEEELNDLYLTELAELYLKNGDKLSAKKLIKKVLRFSDQEKYIEYAKHLLDIIQDEKEKIVKIDSIRTIIYGEELHKLHNDRLPTTEEKELVHKPVQESVHESVQQPEKVLEKKPEKQISLKNLFQQNTRKEKKEKKVISSIEILFDQVVGMQKVKEELQSFYDVLQYQNELMNLGIGDGILIRNFIITGERGSGKSLVAGKIGSLMELFGLIDSDSIQEVNALEVQEAFNKGGNNGLIELFSELQDMVVVIDHIDRLQEESQQNANVSPIADGIVELMRARKDSLIFVLTGTKNAMDQFVNEDMKNLIYSRLDISGYTIKELVEITCILAKEMGLSISNSAYKALQKRIQVERCTGEFANAITLMVILQEAIKRKAERHREKDYAESPDALLQFEEEDFEVEDDVGESIEELLDQLDSLTGLASVKKEVRSKIEGMIIQQSAMEAGSNRSEGFGTLHMVFKGGPGTGKTTIARIIGKIYKKLGILPRGHVFIECTRKDLVGEYQGHTAKKTHDKVKEALGGILFIDEAYSLVHGEDDTFGHEALDTLVADIENYRDSLMVIIAGYSEEIDQLISQNPGLASRFPNEIIFEDYSVDEMANIFCSMVIAKGMVLDKNTSDAVLQLMKEKSVKKDFGNARGVRNLVDKVKATMERRLITMKSEGVILSKNDYEIIKTQDIESVLNQKTIKEKSVEELLNELDNMTGLEGVKKKVREMVALIKRKQLIDKFKYESNNNFGSLHLVFLGNAGTGKTTVARLLGQIYEKLGVLKKGDVFVECSRASLIGQYQGHTTKKVEDKVKEAEGGILFIDEAYDLCHGASDDFGREIVSTLLKEIEDKRDSLMVIMAGYKDMMEEFFGTNQGLKSRMSNEIYFEDYTPEELTKIFYYMAASNHFTVEDGLEEFIKNRIIEEKQKQDDFGNARGVRNLYDGVMRKQALRLSDFHSDAITKEQLFTIIKEDFN